MPRHATHRPINRLFTGDEHDEGNKALDSPAPYLGRRHRILFHDFVTGPALAALAAVAALSRRKNPASGALAGAVHIATDRASSALPSGIREAAEPVVAALANAAANAVHGPPQSAPTPRPARNAPAAPPARSASGGQCPRRKAATIPAVLDVQLDRQPGQPQGPREVPCPACQGHGYRYAAVPGGQQAVQCSNCGGRGRIPVQVESLVPVYREGVKSFWLTPWGQLAHAALCFWLCPLPFSVLCYTALIEGSLPGMVVWALLSQAAWIVPVVLHTRKCLRAQGYVPCLKDGAPILAPPGLMEAHYSGKSRRTTHIPAGSLKAHRPLSSREEWIPAEAWDWLTPEDAAAQGKRKMIGALAPVAVAGGLTIVAGLLGSHALGSVAKLAGGGRRRRR